MDAMAPGPVLRGILYSSTVLRVGQTGLSSFYAFYSCHKLPLSTNFRISLAQKHVDVEDTIYKPHRCPTTETESKPTRRAACATLGTAEPAGTKLCQLCGLKV